MRPFSRRQLARFLSKLERRASSAAVALYTADDQVLVVKASYKQYWSLPGGIVDRSETPKQAAAREVSEEVGVQLEQESLNFCLVVDRVSDLAQTYQFVFDAQVDVSVLASVKIDNREVEAADVVSRQQILNSDRRYSQSTLAWAAGTRGYQEQRFSTKTSQRKA